MKKHSTTAKEFRKPRADFPLFVHPRGHWAKKVRGETKYFGRCDEDPKGEKALLLWLQQKDRLLAGLDPKADAGGSTVGDLCNAFLRAKLDLLNEGEIVPATFQDYKSTTDELVKAFKKARSVATLGPKDFQKLRSKLAKRFGPVALANMVQRVRGVFKFGFDNRIITVPALFGSTFKPPSKKVRRKQRQERGSRMFDAADLKRMIDAAGVPLKAMLLLGINAACGNSDIGHLPKRALDLDGGWLNFPRPKTSISRRIALWPETVKALKVALAKRPAHKDEVDAGIVFITKQGHRWDKLGRFDGEVLTKELAEQEEAESAAPKKKRAKTISSNKTLSKEVRKLAKTLGISRTFYDLRHTFRTVASGARDLEATRAIMGHVNDHVEADYIEEIEDDRLKAVTDYVRDWLYSDDAADKTKGDFQVLRVVG